jgi:hypothetical protein
MKQKQLSISNNDLGLFMIGLWDEDCFGKMPFRLIGLRLELKQRSQLRVEPADT